MANYLIYYSNQLLITDMDMDCDASWNAIKNEFIGLIINNWQPDRNKLAQSERPRP